MELARSASPLVIALLLALTGCDDSSGGTDDPSSDAADTVADASGDPADTELDPGAGDDPETDEITPDVDDTSDATPWDYLTPWEPPRLAWSTCDVEPDGSLAAKAAYYDWIVPALHQVPRGTEGHEDWSRVFDASCDGPVPTTIVPVDELPTCTFRLSENNGLWTSLYIASQAFRYAATREQEALDQVIVTLRGTRRMTDITGTPGLFTRDFRDPALPSQSCPENPMEYVPMGEDMVGNRWVRVDDDGCFLTWAPGEGEGSGEWERDETHCADPAFAGYCWQRNVSKDEYSGHFYAASLVAKLVDDPEAQALATSILRDAVNHLIASEYWVADYDGRPTRYGSAHAMSLDHLPGFQAMLALAWTRAAATVTGDQVFEDFYEGCLLQDRETDDCIDQPLEIGKDYRTYLTDFALRLGCQTNYDNVNMMTLAYTELMLLEPDPELRDFYQQAFHRNSRGPDPDGRDLWSQNNAQLNFTVASLMGPDPEDTDAALDLVRDGVCALQEFRPDNIRRGVDNGSVETRCVSERHGQLADGPMPFGQRCSSVFEWWGDPAQIENCSENLNLAQPPAAYLLPYWMGRYYGFISEDA